MLMKMHVVIKIISMTKTSIDVTMLQFQISPYTMPKKRVKKKSKTVEADSNMEIISRMEIINEDTKAVMGDEKEFKWGKINHMI